MKPGLFGFQEDRKLQKAVPGIVFSMQEFLVQ